MIKVLQYVALMNRAGQETFIMNVYREIDRNVISFDFLCCLPGKGDYDEEISQLGGSVYHIELSKRKSKLKQIDNFIILYHYLKSVKEKYTAFHIHTQHAMDGFLEALAAKMAGIPVVIVHSHSTSTLFHVKAHMYFRSPLNNLKVCKLACSDLAGKWLYGEKGHFEIIHNGVDIQRFRFQKAVRKKVRQENLWNDNIIIGHVGSFSYPKNHEFIIDVFSEIAKIEPRARMVFAGKGELMDEVVAKCQSLNLSDKVTFLGTRTDIDELDQAFDVMLFPSRYEGLPVVLVEAQCTGLPCIISDTITTEVDITDHIVRLNLQKHDAKVWAEKTIEVFENSVNMKRELAYLAVNKNGYSMVDTVSRLSEIYSSEV